MELREMEFTCPFCGKEYVTFIEPSKMQRLYARKELGNDIFKNYNTIYKEMLMSKECSQCQQELPFEDKNNNIERYEVTIDSTNAEKEALKSTITDMIEDCVRE